MSTISMNVISHSPDKQRVVVRVRRNGKSGKYLVVHGMNTIIWTKPKGRISYVITADKCNCPASRGACKHVLATAELKIQGFLGEEKWTVLETKPQPPTFKIINRLTDKWNPLPPDTPQPHIVGRNEKTGHTVAVVPSEFSPPKGWALAAMFPDDVEFGKELAQDFGRIPLEAIRG